MKWFLLYWHHYNQIPKTLELFHSPKVRSLSANHRPALTGHALTLFGHTEALQLLLLVRELFGAHASCPEEHGEVQLHGSPGATADSNHCGFILINPLLIIVFVPTYVFKSIFSFSFHFDLFDHS